MEHKYCIHIDTYPFFSRDGTLPIHQVHSSIRVFCWYGYKTLKKNKKKQRNLPLNPVGGCKGFKMSDSRNSLICGLISVSKYTPNSFNSDFSAY